MSERDHDVALARWRLVLGRYSQARVGGPGGGRGQRLDEALEYLYGREYLGRRNDLEGHPEGGLEASAITAVEWLDRVRDLFPRETVEVLESHALQRYGLEELVTDEEVLERLEPSLDLARTLLRFKGRLRGNVLEKARQVIREVAAAIRRRVEGQVRRSLTGRRNRFRRSPLRVAQNLDWRGTLRENLKHYDPERKRLVVRSPRFLSRVTRHLPWDLFLAVDQSGSMLGSVIHAAVMAGILTALPMLRVRLLVFDTSVVDLTEQAEDPVEVLMSVQLGGGTDIGRAMRTVEDMIEQPRRSLVVLLTDFAEGADPHHLVRTCARMRAAGVKLLGLAALDELAQACFDRRVAQDLADVGMEVAALTPSQFAEWIEGQLQ